ncbi:hypothetical protein PtB15_17B140 [Puccinia triticina]|nr:hypothetical protein PtB15_17B140 [Puccinia triticina]
MRPGGNLQLSAGLENSPALVKISTFESRQPTGVAGEMQDLSCKALSKERVSYHANQITINCKGRGSKCLRSSVCPPEPGNPANNQHRSLNQLHRPKDHITAVSYLHSKDNRTPAVVQVLTLKVFLF